MRNSSPATESSTSKMASSYIFAHLWCWPAWGPLWCPCYGPFASVCHLSATNSALHGGVIGGGPYRGSWPVSRAAGLGDTPRDCRVSTEGSPVWGARDDTEGFTGWCHSLLRTTGALPWAGALVAQGWRQPSCTLHIWAGGRGTVQTKPGACREAPSPPGQAT